MLLLLNKFTGQNQLPLVRLNKCKNSQSLAIPACPCNELDTDMLGHVWRLSPRYMIHFLVSLSRVGLAGGDTCDMCKPCSASYSERWKKWADAAGS